MSVENTDIFSKFYNRFTFPLAPTATANDHLPPFSSPAWYRSAFFPRPLLRRPFPPDEGKEARDRRWSFEAAAAPFLLGIVQGVHLR